MLLRRILQHQLGKLRRLECFTVVFPECLHSPAGRSLRCSAVIKTGLQLPGLLSFLLHSCDRFCGQSGGQNTPCSAPSLPLLRCVVSSLTRLPQLHNLCDSRSHPGPSSSVGWLTVTLGTQRRQTSCLCFLILYHQASHLLRTLQDIPYHISTANKNLASGTGLSWAGGQRPVRF